MSAKLAAAVLRETVPALGALRLDSGRLERLARVRLAATLSAAMRAPLHRERMRDAGVTESAIAADPRAVLCALPPLEKGMLRDAGADACRDGRCDPRWYGSRSSGSTGEPFTMRFDARAWAILKYLVKVRSRHACGLRPDHRVAIIDAIPPEAEGDSVAERLGRVRRVSLFRPPGEVARLLEAFAPHAIYGLPSALVEAGRERRRAAPAARVFTGGELMPAAVRAALAEQYGGPVHDSYGTSETKEIAWECPVGGAHVNADVLHVEVLDESGAVVPVGSEGSLAVTVLVNEAMPLVRYRTGDRARLLATPCACGRALPLLGVLAGREADMLELAGGRRLSPYTLTTTLERVGGLQRYQVTQLEPARLRVRAVAGGGVDRESARRRVDALLRAELGTFVRIDVEFVERFTLPLGRKFRVVEPLAATYPAPDSDA